MSSMSNSTTAKSRGAITTGDVVYHLRTGKLLGVVTKVTPPSGMKNVRYCFVGDRYLPEVVLTHHQPKNRNYRRSKLPR